MEENKIKKIKIPFPTIGSAIKEKVEEAPASELPVEREYDSEADKINEFEQQQREIIEQEQKAIISKLSCKHQISLPVLVKGMTICGNCKQHILINNQWFELDQEVPDDWFKS